MTSKRDRFLTAATGGRPDRPPVGAWIHFGSSFWTPVQVAEAHLRWYREYDWDYLKVMNDFRLELPAGLTEITDPAQLDAVVADPDAELANLARQAEVLRLIRAAAPEAAIIETIFSPAQTLVRALGGNVIDHLRADPDLAQRTLDRVAHALARWASGLGGLGVDGVFFAINGASTDATSHGLSPAEFSELIAPHDRHVLAAAEPLVRIGHLHGVAADPELIGDYPIEVLSWSDLVSPPTIADARDRHGWVPMLGLDELDSLYQTPSQTVEAVRRARLAAGDRLIVAPNCTLHSDGNPGVLCGLRASVEAPLATR